jgi:hypothetical protein
VGPAAAVSPANPAGKSNGVSTSTRISSEVREFRDSNAPLIVTTSIPPVSAAVGNQSQSRAQSCHGRLRRPALPLLLAPKGIRELRQYLRGRIICSG